MVQARIVDREAEAPARPGRSAALTYLAVFAATLVIFFLANVLRDGTPAMALSIGVPMVIGDALIAVPLYPLLRRTEGMKAGRRWTLMVLAGLLVAFAQTWWDTEVRLFVGAITPAFAQRMFATSMPLNTYHTGMLVALLAFQRAYLTIVAQQRQVAVAQAGERDARLASLRFQLNPHFLFNSMNALSSLVVLGRNGEAEAMIERLTTFLRSALAADPQGMVMLSEEFDMLEAYLEIEHVRFGARLVTALELPDALAPARVPPFLLQPLVENAMKYAVGKSSEPVAVTIAAARDGDRLVLTVVDDGRAEGPLAGGTGLGLVNIRQRLRIEYGEAARLETRREAAGFTATITLPLDLAKARAAAA